MAYYNFDYQVFDPTKFNPAPTTFSLSSSGSTVAIDSVGTVNGQQVVGIAFNAISSAYGGTAAGALVTLSAYPGTQFRVDKNYNTQQMALLYSNGYSSIFSVLTGSGTTVQVLTAAGTDVSYPELRRKRLLGF